MSDHVENEDDFFLGVMVLKEGKWVPQRKFDGGSFGSALIHAEDLDREPGIDGVKVMRIPKKGSSGQKEMWISPRIKARSEAQATSQLRAGVKKTEQSLAAARKASVAK